MRDKLFVLARVEDLIVTQTRLVFSTLQENCVLEHVIWLDATGDSATIVGKTIANTGKKVRSFCVV